MNENLPEGFGYLQDPRMIISMNYATNDNFVGRKIHGYERQICILTNEAIAALIAVQDELDEMKRGYALKIFDAYRPVQAVKDFVAWSDAPEDKAMRDKYHPYFTKKELFEFGYIHEHSSHSRGSTVDLTIVIRNGDQHTELDMGSCFDFFGEESNTDAKNISPEAQKNRKLLLDVMNHNDFENFYLEWWHYTLLSEPFEHEVFDFPVR